MNKDQQYKIFFENWKKYVQEQAFDLPKTKTYKSKFPDKKSKTTFEPPKFDISNQAKLSDTLKKLGATIDAEDPDFMDTMSKAICGLLNQMGVFMQLQSDLDNQDETTESSAGGFSGWLLKQVGKAASISGDILQKIAEFLPGCEGYEDLQTKWEEKQKKKKEKTSTGTATGTTTTTTTKNGKKVKVKLDTRNILIPDECLDAGNAMQASRDPRCPIYYNGTEEEQIQKAREYIAKQQKKKTEKPTPGKKVKIADWKKDTEFLNKVKTWSDKNGVPMKNILAVMLHETAGSMDPAEKNEIGCVGLIQFCPGDKAGQALVGKTGDELAAMTRAEQWDYVEKFLEKNNKWKSNPTSLSTLYLSIFLPAFAGLPNNAILATETGTGVHSGVKVSKKFIKQVWKQNPANRDKTKKGDPITKAGIARNLAQRWRNELDIDSLALTKTRPRSTGR